MKRTAIGTGIVLTGNLMFGWGLYHLMGIGSCGGVYPECPSSSWPYFVALPVGILLSITGIFVGGLIGFVSLFATVGIASIWRGIDGGVGGEGDTTFAYVFGAFFLVPSVLPLLFIPFGKRRKERAERLRREGKKGVATVTAVEDTNVTINDDPRVLLRLSVQPNNADPAFEGEKALVVSRVDVPRVGDRYPVWYDPQDPSRFDLGNRIQAAQPASSPSPSTEAAPAAAHSTDWVTELGRLNDLRLSGALTDEEFTRAKDRLLAGSPPAPAGG